MSEERKTFSTAFRPAGDGLGHVLGELETQVMEATWAIGRPATVREVLGRLDRDAGRAYNTVMTVMVRLTDKGLLQRAKHEGVWHYQPTLGEAEFRERVSGEVLRGLLQLAPEATLSQLVELLAEDDPGALDDLLRLIAARRAVAMQVVQPVEPPVGDAVHIAIRECAFVGKRIVIAAGTTVQWANDDDVVHTATSDDAAWNSGAIPPGQSWSARFDQPGTYSYHCGPHPYMRGSIVVQ